MKPGVWHEAEKSPPDSMACLVRVLVMAPAGRNQVRTNPRIVTTMGGFLVGAGMIIAGLTTSPFGQCVYQRIGYPEYAFAQANLEWGSFPSLLRRLAMEAAEFWPVSVATKPAALYPWSPALSQ